MLPARPHEIPNPEPCAPAFITDALFPVALTLLLVLLALTAVLLWTTYRFKISGIWAALAGLLTLAAGGLTYMSTLTC